MFYCFIFIGITSCNKAEINPTETTQTTEILINTGSNNHRGLGEGENEDPYVQLNGEIINKIGQTIVNQPIDLLSFSDSLIVASEISSHLGEFEMLVAPGSYRFYLEFLNGNEIYTDPFQLIDTTSVVIILE